MLFLWFSVAYITAYKLGVAVGEIRERDREQRAERKAVNRIIDIRDHR